MKLNKTLRSALSFALAAAMTVTTLTPTAIFAAPEEAAPQEEAVAEAVAAPELEEADEAEAIDLEATPREDLDEHVLSYTAYTDTVSFAGQKLTGVFIQYDGDVVASTVRTSTYEVQSVKGDNKTFAPATITAVYTNNEPAFREDKQSVSGPYVIIEISEYDGVGTVDLSNIYVTDEDGKEYRSGGYGNLPYDLIPVVTQKANVTVYGGEGVGRAYQVSAGTFSTSKYDTTIYNNIDQFQTLILDSEKNNYGDGKITVQYYLPEGYSEDREYPMIFVECGGGLRLREIFNDAGDLVYSSAGANIMFDTSATSWMDAEYKEKYPFNDIIVVSVDNRNIADSENPEARYVAADDINQTVEYFIENYSVDPDRIYYSGNSQGSLIGYQTVSSRPDLWAAFMACNGLALTSPDPFSSEENMAKYMEGVAKVMDPITENHVAMYWNLGETDTGASGPRGELFYDYARAKYEEQGLDPATIESLLVLNVFADEEYLEYGIINADGTAYAHGATKLAYTAHKDDFQPWILGQSKSRPLGPGRFYGDVESVQAFTDGTVYGAAVVEIVVTFKPDVDLTGITAEDFYVEDRGSLNPDFGQVKIESIKVDGQKVTLYVDDDTQATENNHLVYTGNNESEADIKGSRERNAFGIYCTGAWYRDENGIIRYGRDDNDEYENNTSGQGYQVRHSLELKIRYADDFSYTSAQCLADEYGEYNEGGLWLPTVDREFGPGKFQNLYDLQIPSTAANTEETPITDGTDDPYVRGFYYVPENYDPANGIVFYLQGQGISYWKLADGCDNEGCGFYYDTNTYSWMNKGCIAVNIQDRSSAGRGQYSTYYDYVEDDVNVMKYFIEKYGVTGNIVIQGNSRGTNASSMVIKALAGRPYRQNGSNSRDLVTLDKSVYNFDIDTFLCQNGTFGGSNYSAEDWAAIAATGMKVWCFDGEQDSNNIGNLPNYIAALKAIGYDDEWIEENVRLTGLASEMFAYWGESDHSVTRINSWYFADDVYYGPDFYVEDGQIVYNTKLADGDTYKLKGRGTAATNGKAEYEYKIYDDLFQVWALQPTENTSRSLADDIVSVQAYTDGTFYGTGLVKVVVTFKNGVDTSGLTAEDFVIEDRGSLNPDFGQIKIASLSRSRQTVTLNIDANATAATEINELVYSGSGEHGSRERNAFGIYPTGNWYRDPDGVIRYGNGEQGYAANTENKGYWIRPSLELKIRYADELGFRAAACLADDKGQYNAGSLWLPTVDQEFGEGRFQNLYDLKIPSTAAPATDGTQDEYVQGYYYVPANYDPANGIVFYIQGNAISFWKIQDGTNNAGCGFMYDVNTYSWRDNGCIAVNIQDRSGYARGDYQNYYDYVTDDVNVMKYFIDTYGVTGNIVIQGNSRGTSACTNIIKALAGRPYTKLGESVTLDKSVYDFEIDTYICQNGGFGGGYTEEDWAAVAATGMKVWCFDGEQDSNNIDNLPNYRAALAELGYSEEWIDENVRLTGLASEIFAYWGETDHSVTRLNPWYFADAAYYGPDLYIDDQGKIVYNTKLEDGDTYTLKARGAAAENSKNGYEYKVYDDLFQVWALEPIENQFVKDVKSVQAYTDGTFYGTGVVRIVVTFNDDVDISEITADDFVIVDRGSLKPDFIPVKIKSYTVNNNNHTVTLYVDGNTTATEINSLVYSGNNEDEAQVKGSRQRNAYGIYPTGDWYRDPAGTIRYGNGDSYAANETGKGYWIRPSLELKIGYASEADAGFTEAQCLADEWGQYNANGLWLETVDTEFGEGKFQNVYDLQIPSTSAPAEDGSGDPYVQGYYYVPANYNPADGIVFYIMGNAISYWQMPDGTNNAGCGFMYDVNTYSWRNKGAIVVNIQDRSSYVSGDYQKYYDYILDDVNVMKYFIEEYGVTGNIVIQGNSRGTMASSAIIKALAGQPYTAHGETLTLDKNIYDFEIDTYIAQNGSLGSGYNASDWAAVAATGMKTWVFDGEQDSNNINSVATYKEALKEAGYSDAWVEENVRLTGLASDMFYYWGETDHSVTRLNPWYFADAAYYGPDFYIDEEGKLVYNTKLKDGDTYKLPARGTARTNGKAEYEYKVYDDLFQEWALRNTDDLEAVKVSAVTKPGHFGQKLKAVILEFPEEIDASKLSTDSFIVRDKANNLTGAYRNAVIERVYVSGTPELDGGGLLRAVNRGKYVIIETNDFDKIGLVADTWYYYNANGGTGSVARRKDLAGVYYLDVLAAQDIVDVNGNVVLAAQSVPMVIDQDSIKHEYLDEFNYVYLNDEEADAVLAKFTFKNNNSPYSLSSNSRNNDHSALQPNEVLGDLNYATLSGLGVRIWYQLPENYDPNKTYPLFLYAHGTGESMTESGRAVAADGTEYNNHGVHFNIGYPAGAWAMTEEFGYEDAIVVAPQYYNGNSPRADGYERDDAFRVALCWALDSLAVDRDRVFVSGTSQGAGRTTALVRDCAEYITAAIVQNGGYSSGISRRQGTNGAGQTPVEEHEMIFKFATDENVAFWFFQGVNDRTSPPITSETMYQAIVNNYKAAGKTDEWIEEHVRYTYLNDKIYLDMNETSFHSSMKPTYNWYAYYRDAEYNAAYSDAEDSLGAYFDTKYGDNDPNGYKGLVDWALNQDKSELNGETDPVEEFVKKLYREFLGREGEPAGVATWTNALKSGRATMAQLIYGFVYSSEFQNNPLSNEEFVTALYRIIFDREPDAAGLAAWVKVLEDGCTRKKVLEGFLNSAELKALADKLGVVAGSYKSNELIDQYPSVTAFVSRLYKLVLGRTPSKGELDAWVSALVNRGSTARQVVRGFFLSRELANRLLDSEALVKVMYNTILNREADNRGLSDWLAAFSRYGIDKVLDGIMKSPEFRALAESYGIIP